MDLLVGDLVELFDGECDPCTALLIGHGFCSEKDTAALRLANDLNSADLVGHDSPGLVCIAMN